MDVLDEFGLLRQNVLEGAHGGEVAGDGRPELGLAGEALLNVASELTAHDADEIVLEEAVVGLEVAGGAQLVEIGAGYEDGGLIRLQSKRRQIRIESDGGPSGDGFSCTE